MKIKQEFYSEKKAIHKICKEKISKTFFGHYYKVCLQKIIAVQETQSISIHDVLNAQGFAMHYRAISSTISHF